MATRRRHSQFRNGIYDTLMTTEDPAFESINEIFESIIERIVLVTAEGEYLITTSNDKIKEN